jgi:hypothetical protein
MRAVKNLLRREAILPKKHIRRQQPFEGEVAYTVFV